MKNIVNVIREAEAKCFSLQYQDGGSISVDFSEISLDNTAIETTVTALEFEDHAKLYSGKINVVVRDSEEILTDVMQMTVGEFSRYLDDELLGDIDRNHPDNQSLIRKIYGAFYNTLGVCYDQCVSMYPVSYRNQYMISIAGHRNMLFFASLYPYPQSVFSNGPSDKTSIINTNPH